MTKLEEQLKEFEQIYSPSLLEDFILYWDEPDMKGKRKWQSQKTWNTGMRLRVWKKRQEKWDWERSQRQQLKNVDEYPTHREQKQVEIKGDFNSLKEIL